MALLRNPDRLDTPVGSHARSCAGSDRIPRRTGMKVAIAAIFGACLCLLAAAAPLLQSAPARAQTQAPGAVDAQKSIQQKLGGLRQLPDEERGRVTRQLALDIRKLAPEARVNLASGLANLA